MSDATAVAPAGGAATDNKVDPRKNMNYPLVQKSDMPEELRLDAMETLVTAIEKYPGNYEAAAKLAKETLDKKFGATWHCVIGEGFGFDVTYQMRNLMYMYFGGNIAVLLFKAS
jgi:dynein light chain 4